MPLGPLMLDLAGTELTPDERERLAHPLVGGVILFTRNYQSPEQVADLVRSIHAARTPPLLVAVDHEGGRVQRFRDGFTRIPPMRLLGDLWDRHPQRARTTAQHVGFVLASELRAVGVDFSFAPVLDLDYANSVVIGDRAFHRNPRAVAELGRSLVAGMHGAGMAAVGKHFPGHGFTAADSHHELPVDPRPLGEIEGDDLLPFRQLCREGLAGVMPAHVVYPEVDALPAGYSSRWIERILRQDIGFEGTVFSDDLSMAGATALADVVDRAHAAMAAGCDMILVCNDTPAVDRVLAHFRHEPAAIGMARLARMRGGAHPPDLAALRADQRHIAGLAAIGALVADGSDTDLFRSPGAGDDRSA